MSNRITIYAILISSVIQFSSCKKDNAPSVGFSKSQVSLDAVLSPTATVNVNVSAATNNIIQLWFTLEGPGDTLQFGTYNAAFISDDSARISGTLGAIATIDSPRTNSYMCKVSLPYSATSFAINLSALFDNFPKRAVTYKIKITQAINANISSSSNELTINVASTPMTPVFSSTLTIPQPGGPLTYALSNYAFTPVGGGLWNFDMTYSLTKGSDSLQSFNLQFTNITPALGPQVYLDMGDTVKTNFVLSPTPSSVRGNYYIMNDQAGAVKVMYKDSTGVGDLQSGFVLF